MGFLPILALILGVLLLSWISWMSLQSLLQARILFRLAGLRRLEPDGYGRQALYGQVRVERAVQKGFGELLWCRTVEQIYRRRGKNSGWRTVGTTDETASFTLEADGRELVLSGLPTEVQGTRERTETHDRNGLFGWVHTSGDRRTVYTYLPVVPRATVVGRRVGPAAFGPDNKLGLLLSPHPPEEAAWTELGKGLAGLAVVTAALIAGLVIYYR